MPCHATCDRAVPIRQATAEPLERTLLKPSKYCIFDLLKGTSPFSEGKTLNATIKLIKDMGNKYPKKPIRQPHEPAMKPSIGEATRKERLLLEMIDPIALDLSSWGKKSPTRVIVMGATIAIASPVRAKKKAMVP